MSHQFDALGVYIFAGGFTLGVRDHFNVQAHLEGSAYGTSTVRANMKLPIWTRRERWPLSRFAGVDYVYGNPPCAAWSVAGASMRKGKTQWTGDKRVDCTRNLFQVLVACEPKVWMWESVTQAFSRGRDLVDELTQEAVRRGYAVTYLFTSALFHGIPQPRKRFLMVCHKVDLDFYKPDTLPTSVGRALGLRRMADPLDLRDDELSEDGRWAQTCPVWGVPPCNPHTQGAIKLTLPGDDLESGWRKWYQIDPKAAGAAPAYFVNRLHPEGIGGTQTSQVMHVHPVYDRFVADSECARLSSYPDDYVWVPDHFGNVRAQIAQAVLPNVGRYLAEVTRKGLEANVPAEPGKVREVWHFEPTQREKRS